MTRPPTIAVVVGSLRAESVNRALFNTAVDLFGDLLALVEVPVNDVPFYNGDVEDAGDPPAVTALKEAVAASDGVVFFTPEYNRSVPAVTKNAVDWLSRPPFAGPIAGKPTGIIAVTGGRHDASGVREHLTVAIAGAAARLYEESLGVGSINHRLIDGVLDDETAELLLRWAEGFAEFVAS